MSKYKFIYLTWLLPGYLLFLTLHQVAVYYGITDTYENGESYTAEVVESDIKQIAAQTNGYVVLRFEPASGDRVQRKLSLPIELAAMTTDLRQIPIRYQKGAFEEIVMMPTYDSHRNMVLSNAGISSIGFLITLIIAIFAHRYASKKEQEEDTEYIIERID